CCSCTENNITLIGADFCEHCGHEADNCVCGGKYSAYFDHLAAPFVYSGMIKSRLCDFKFYGETNERDFFAYHMSVKFSEAYPLVKPDIITYVPMTGRAQKKRGYNQSRLLAIELSKRLLVPCDTLLVKKSETSRQHDLSAEERTKNLIGAFGPVKEADITGKIIVLCDDIKTTGSTLSECVKVLKQAGAKEVYCLCAAVSDYSPDLHF
ncbi:MAG: ComF family protein, partial [Acutalibacteraceae bacterium]